MAERMRNLLKPATPFRWDDSLDQLFEESKTAITTEIARSSTKLNQHALQQIGPDTASASGFFKNTVRAHQLTSFAVDMDGKSPWRAVDSPILQNLGMHQSKERLWL